MKKKIEQGLNGLLAQTKQAPTMDQETATSAKNVTRPYKVVCYNLPVELDDALRRMAKEQRRKINAVLSEAIELYIKTQDENK